MRPDLFQYTDYRAFLRDWLWQAKEETPAISYRFLARRLKIDPGFLVHIFQGHKHLSETHLPGMVRVLGLDGRQGDYFQRLVAFGRARGEREIARRYEELMELRESRIRELSASEHRYYQNWYVPALRCLLATRQLRGDGSDLGELLHPPITAKQAREAVALLQHLELIRRAEDGTWEVTDQHLSSGDAWTDLAIHSFQRQTIQLALDALESLPKEQREVSTMTLAIAKEELPTVQAMVREFRSKLARWAVRSADADTVYQMNIQIFPLVKP